MCGWVASSGRVYGNFWPGTLLMYLLAPSPSNQPFANPYFPSQQLRDALIASLLKNITDTMKTV